ncbi:MAG: efflux RND transporter periplasmic adaptor subunit [Myxococcota bacterium]
MNDSMRRAALASALLLVGCGAAGADTAAGPDAAAKVTTIAVRTVSLSPSTFDDRVEANGSLAADNDATLSARGSGTLEFLAPLGTPVKKGQVVARIDPAIPATGVRQAEAARDAASAQVSLARENHDRQKPLYDEGVISALEFQQLQSQYASARADFARSDAALAQARESLANTRMVAPFAGVVDAHLVDRGEQVAPGTPVVRVVDARRLLVKAGIPERYAADIVTGAEVDVALPSYGLEPRRGRVRFVATAIDARSRTFDVEVTLDNQDGRLKPEMLAKIVVTRARLQDVLVVPQDAVLRDEVGLHVFLVSQAEGLPKARRKTVNVAGRAGGNVVVEGLSAGDEVVVLGQTKLIDGDFIEATKVGAANAAVEGAL